MLVKLSADGGHRVLDGDLVVEYRLRWSKPWQAHKTRYFKVGYHARRAQARYQAAGYITELDERSVLVVDDWTGSLPD